MRISDSKYGALISIPGLLVVILLILFPSLLMIIVSFLKYTFINPPSFIGFGNFKYIFNDRLFWLALKNTIIYSGSVTLLTSFSGIILALFLSRISKKAAFFRTLAMFPWAVPLVISGFIWSWILDPQVGIVSYILMQLRLISEPLPTFSNSVLAMIGVIVADVWVRTPFMTVFVLAGIDSIPQELYEVAEVDGADFLDSFRYITLPLIKRMVFIGLLITSMFTFRTIDVIYSMTSGGPARATYVLGLYVIEQMWERVNYGTSAAASVILFVLISIFASFYIYLVFKE